VANIDQEALESAVEIAEVAEEPLQLDRITLSNGIVLKLKSVPPFLARQAVISLQRPKPPRVFLEDKGREEENPNDPVYLDELRLYEARSIEVGVNVMLLTGTEVQEIPNGCYGPEDDGWLENLEALDVVVEREKPRARYLAWLRYYALQSTLDITRVTAALGRRVGLSEEEVAASADSFRNRAARRADKRLSAKAARDGNNV
jgi:hypothetical protein